jgi:hypothetical protein
MVQSVPHTCWWQYECRAAWLAGAFSHERPQRSGSGASHSRRAHRVTHAQRSCDDAATRQQKQLEQGILYMM